MSASAVGSLGRRCPSASARLAFSLVGPPCTREARSLDRAPISTRGSAGLGGAGRSKTRRRLRAGGGSVGVPSVVIWPPSPWWADSRASCRTRRRTLPRCRSVAARPASDPRRSRPLCGARSSRTTTRCRASARRSPPSPTACTRRSSGSAARPPRHGSHQRGRHLGAVPELEPATRRPCPRRAPSRRRGAGWFAPTAHLRSRGSRHHSCTIVPATTMLEWTKIGEVLSATRIRHTLSG